ncbi:MAG: hypothetical protein EHM34_06515 [Nitrosopumilales archaeon]|nr:MAG: hypothetical protein EHM34_06515 [Nitrosopumilales archaeon]
MNGDWLNCRNPSCRNKLRVQISNADSKPITFCSESCFNSILLFENEKAISRLDYDDPHEVKTLVQNLVKQTQQLQIELDNLKKIRKTYFGLFKDQELKDETYKREWSFDKE